DCPSCTRIERTTPVSNGWMILVRLLGTTLPVADATISIVPHHDHSSAAQNSTMMVITMERPIGDGGVSMTSSAAGRKASSSRPDLTRRNGTTVSFHPAGSAVLDDFIDASLQAMQRRIASAGLDQRVMGAVLD